MLDRFEIKKSEETGMFSIFDKKKYNTCIHNKKATDETFQTKEDAERWIIRHLYTRMYKGDSYLSYCNNLKMNSAFLGLARLRLAFSR